MKISEVKTTEETIELLKVYGWLFAVVIVMLVFGLTVFAMLYSVIFVTQPIKSMAPIDQAFTKLLNDVVLLLVGSISTLIGMFAINKGAKSFAERLNPTPPMQPMCQGNNQSYNSYGSSYAPPQSAYGLPSQPFGAMLLLLLRLLLQSILRMTKSVRKLHKQEKRLNDATYPTTLVNRRCSHFLVWNLQSRASLWLARA
jgi:hypothetical protein